MPLDKKQIRALLKNQADHKILTEKHLALLQHGKELAKNIEEAKTKTTRLIDERDQLIVLCVHEEISYNDICASFGVSRQRAQQVARSIDLVRRVLTDEMLAAKQREKSFAELDAAIEAKTELAVKAADALVSENTQVANNFPRLRPAEEI